MVKGIVRMNVAVLNILIICMPNSWVFLQSNFKPLRKIFYVVDVQSTYFLKNDKKQHLEDGWQTILEFFVFP